MTNARDIMHQGAECIGETETLADAARKMRDLHVGALPVCGEDDRLHGIITDRDIVVKCIADGRDPQAVTARELAQGTPVWYVVAADEGHGFAKKSNQDYLRMVFIEFLRRTVLAPKT